MLLIGSGAIGMLGLLAYDSMVHSRSSTAPLMLIFVPIYQWIGWFVTGVVLVIVRTIEQRR